MEIDDTAILLEKFGSQEAALGQVAPRQSSLGDPFLYHSLQQWIECAIQTHFPKESTATLIRQ